MTEAGRELGGDVRRSMALVGGRISGGAWTGDAATTFRATFSGLAPELDSIISALEIEALALDAYASSVDQIAADADLLRRRLGTADQKIGQTRRALDREASSSALLLRVATADLGAELRLARLEETLADAVHEKQRIEREWLELTGRRQDTDRRCLRDLDAVSGSSAVDAGQVRLATSLGIDGFVRWVLSLSGFEVATALELDPGLADRLSQLPPDVVAAWWRSLGDPAEPHGTTAAQLALLAAIPAVLGNLDGVAFRHRDLANRSVLKAELERLKAIEALIDEQVQREHAAPDGELYMRAGFASLQDFLTALAAAQNVDATLRHADASVTYQLVHYVTGVPPLAAVSVGDMDRATNITVTVAGMKSTPAGDMRTWTEGASNLQLEQAGQAARQGVDADFAVVAWLGYESPRAARPDVWYGDRGERGAQALSSFIAGTSHVRGWDAGRHVSLVGYSYGSNVVARATISTAVENMVLLGSSGLPQQVEGASALRLDPSRLWVTEANADSTADWGRVPWGDHPVNPQSQSFGAKIFSSEDAVVEQEVLHGTTGHGSTPQTYAKRKGFHSGEYGYLDAATTSLRNTALVTAGLDLSQVVRP